MSDDDLLDMDYFLHEDDDIFNNLDDDDVVDFFLFLSHYIFSCCACFSVGTFFFFTLFREVSYKVKIKETLI